MKTKKVIKEMFNNKYNREKVKEEIIQKEEKKKREYVKWALVPISILLIVGLALLGGNGNKILTPNYGFIDRNKNTFLYFNDANPIMKENNNRVITTSANTSVEKWFDEVVPDDLEPIGVYMVYVKKNDGQKTFNNYINYYADSEGMRSINIAYSKKYKPLRDYYYVLEDTNSFSSKVGDTEFNLYQDENLYFTTFYYDGIYFDIEAHNISESEIATLLSSIIK